jgi:hypothetical protein
MDCAPFASRRDYLENGKDSYTLRPARAYGNSEAVEIVRNQFHLGAVTLKSG